MIDFFGDSTKVDHIAIAVNDIDQALFLYEGIFGFKLLQRREISGAFSGMRSAELDAGGFSIVLVQGTDPKSQVSRYIQEYGPGVQHIAIAVDDVEELADKLRDSGVTFATSIIRGEGLIQIFTQRDTNTGMMFEFIQRLPHVEGFEESNVQQLFEQLEESEAY